MFENIKEILKFLVTPMLILLSCHEVKKKKTCLRFKIARIVGVFHKHFFFFWLDVIASFEH